MSERQEGTLVIQEGDLRRVKDITDLARRNLRMARGEFLHHDHAPMHSSVAAAEAQLEYAAGLIEQVEDYNKESHARSSP